MGGCRCTYRNCTVKSDGKTHMFHYPVFEKVRCHQWLINAHRLEFLNLKVSQLKNRVVCQHHFKDENFMNFKKDKLTFDAIPTEDGPYCDVTNYVDVNPDSSKLFSIIIEDMENDYNDKKANYSLKYGDFLANLDLMDIEKIDEDSTSYKNIYNNNVDILSPSHHHKGKSNGRLFSDDTPFLYNISLPDKSDNKCLTHPTLAVSPYVSATDVSINDVKKFVRFKSKGENISTDTNHSVLVGNANGNEKFNQETYSDINIIQKQEPQKKEPKIKIISEKKVTDPVAITGKFEPVSPNFVLNVSKMRRKTVSENLYHNISKSTENKDTDNEDKSKTLEIEIVPLVKEEDTSKTQHYNPPMDLLQNSFVSEKSPKMSVIKPRVPPERVEAINKKREFNMKLRDMVETCLDKIDNFQKSNEKSKPLKNTKSNKRKAQCATSIPKTSTVLSPQEYTISFLEARMREMENTLLEKIEQNSVNIIEIKNSLTAPEKQLVVKTDEETHKRQLFKDIAKYLSPDSKSLIYEELFINKFGLNEPVSPKRKRRRRKW